MVASESKSLPTDSLKDLDSSTEKTRLLGSHHQIKPPEGECFGSRHVLAFMAFLGFFNVYCLRVNLSVALVAMVNSTKSAANESTSTECPVTHLSNTTEKNTGEFNWSENTQGQILGAFFYGYILTQIPGGWLGEKIGGKKLFGLGVLCTAVLTLLTPIVARWSLGGLIALRVIEGIGEGVTFPAMNAIWGHWAPLWERSKLSSFTYAGAQLGTVFSMPLSGILCNSDFLGGWPSVFYVFGALGCIWFAVWMLVVHDTPAEHPRISKEEREYIEKSVGVRERVTTPWKSIVTSPPLWAITASHFANNWGYYTMLTCLPTYMKNILHFNIQEDGFISALPYLVCWISQNSSGQIADFLRRRHIFSTKNTRKIVNSVGLLTPAILMCCVQFAGCNSTAVVVMLTFAVGLGGFCMGGFNVNHLDIAPNYAGTLMGFTNMFATIPGFAGPAIVGVLTDSNETRHQWQYVFYISAGVYLFGCIIFNLFADGEEQDWNTPKRDVLSFHGNGKNVPYEQIQQEINNQNYTINITPGSPASSQRS
ncbi:hypothetical protein FSP39_013989 [Pinctada imbricata]|uniref:Sialin n=1 Tax=Pinctada imbricata TaxID=66713 RepID=A0AA89BZ47_PINIB|nr:hypothetical protein FSP39_013989 [Pinctada imbricata]